ncbi:hypothetical protein SUNI508_00594 [Seiridium unicorne]|uniref:Uncharacterized protein n=1 Tax=Seiridium unicorne TaxID=138068 RepID=A0ABR2V7B9_9PEZI
MAADQPQVVEPYSARAGYLQATDWAIPYYSPYVSENDLKNYRMYSHVNCSYLSTPGRPPTLAALKKHAQSLAYLISTIAPSQGPGEINNAKSGDPSAKQFTAEEAFDWLNNLEEAYHSDDPGHHRPLNSLVNLAKSNSDTKGVEFSCPLECPRDRKSAKAEDEQLRLDRGAMEEAYQDERQVKPFARHWNLLRHANECLEILDHEFSSTGGLLSILPTEHEAEAEQLDFAKNTLVGGWLLFAQQLVARMHDLEIDYANSLDLLAGEAIIPMQNLSVHGPDGRSGRELVFPQDRWVLANAGDDVMTYVHQVLDRKQISEDHTLQAYRNSGVVGDTLWNEAMDSQRGIVSVDLITRYYRIKGSANDRGPIFILPAFGDRPGTKHTRMMEDRPTVVSVIEPKDPLNSDSMSHLETKYRKKMADCPPVNQKECDDLRDQVQKLTKELELEKEKSEQEKIKLSSLRDAASPNQVEAATRATEATAKLNKEVEESKKREQEAIQRADDAEQWVKDLTTNNYSQISAAGRIPRDIDGHATEQALKALLNSLRKASDDNKRLKSNIATMQQNARTRLSARQQTGTSTGGAATGTAGAATTGAAATGGAATGGAATAGGTTGGAGGAASGSGTGGATGTAP